MYKEILLAIDGSDHSHRAVEQAIKMVSSYQGNVKINLIYCVDGESSKNDILKYGDSHTSKIKRKEKFYPVIKEIESYGIESDIVLLHGDPAETIIDYANNHAYDCVVVGSRGRNDFQTLVLGSVSHKLVKYVDSPVLVIK